MLDGEVDTSGDEGLLVNISHVHDIKCCERLTGAMIRQQICMLKPACDHGLSFMITLPALPFRFG